MVYCLYYTGYNGLLFTLYGRYRGTVYTIQEIKVTVYTIQEIKVYCLHYTGDKGVLFTLYRR